MFIVTYPKHNASVDRIYRFLVYLKNRTSEIRAKNAELLESLEENSSIIFPNTNN